jgi:hypothetical protein
MIMGFKHQLPLFILFAGAIFLVQRKFSLNLQTVMMNQKSSLYLQDDKKTHAVLSQNQQQHQLNSAVQ